MGVLLIFGISIYTVYNAAALPLIKAFPVNHKGNTAKNCQLFQTQNLNIGSQFSEMS